MSHVFISYKNEDQYQLSALKAVLDEAGIISWHDEGLAAGEDWRNEIDNRIDNCSAMVVIITNRSVESHYVTYEWSRALGNGKAVIPALFEKHKPEKLHSCLASLQSISCFPEVSIDLIGELKRKSKETFLSRYTRYVIIRQLQPFRTLVDMLRLNEALKKRELNISNETEDILLSAILHELYLLRDEVLVQFWLSSAHALTFAQRRMFEEFSSNVEMLCDYCWKASLRMATESTLGRIGENLPDDHESSDTIIRSFLALWKLTEEMLINQREDASNPYYFYKGHLNAISNPDYVGPQRNIAERLKIAIEFVVPMTADHIVQILRRAEQEILDKCKA